MSRPTSTPQDPTQELAKQVMSLIEGNEAIWRSLDGVELLVTVVDLKSGRVGIGAHAERSPEEEPLLALIHILSLHMTMIKAVIQEFPELRASFIEMLGTFIPN